MAEYDDCGVHLKLLLEVKEAKIQEVANSES